MRQKTIRRMLAVITGEGYSPTEAHRELVVLLKLNDVSHDRIATAVGISRLTLEYYYAKELDLGVTAIIAHCTKRMLWLANQNADLGVALKANAMVLQPRVKAWRDASEDVSEGVGDISDKTLEQVEADIERLERQRRAAADAEAAAAGIDPDEEEFG
jgi:hypothetical protein